VFDNSLVVIKNNIEMVLKSSRTKKALISMDTFSHQDIDHSFFNIGVQDLLVQDCGE